MVLRLVPKTAMTPSLATIFKASIYITFFGLGKYQNELFSDSPLHIGVIPPLAVSQGKSLIEQ
jgi:hypothetical protein